MESFVEFTDTLFTLVERLDVVHDALKYLPEGWSRAAAEPEALCNSLKNALPHIDKVLELHFDLPFKADIPIEHEFQYDNLGRDIDFMKKGIDEAILERKHNPGGYMEAPVKYERVMNQAQQQTKSIIREVAKFHGSVTGLPPKGFLTPTPSPTGSPGPSG